MKMNKHYNELKASQKCKENENPLSRLTATALPKGELFHIKRKSFSSQQKSSPTRGSWHRADAR